MKDICSLFTNHQQSQRVLLQRRDPERAPVRHAAWRLVGVQAARRQVRGGDVVGGERGVHQADLELARLRVGEEVRRGRRRCASGRRGSFRRGLSAISPLR